MRTVFCKLLILVQVHVPLILLERKVVAEGTDVETQLIQQSQEKVEYEYYEDYSEDIENLSPGLRRRRRPNKSRGNALLAELLGFVNQNKKPQNSRPSVLKPKPIKQKDQYPEGLNPNKPVTKPKPIKPVI